MLRTKSALLSVLALSFGAPAAIAAVPASGDLGDAALSVQWEGSGPYVVTNVTPANGADTVVCEPAVPQVCDQFSVNVSITQEFRELPENQRESVKIAISFPTTTTAEDYDLYLYDAAGTVIGESATGGQEAITVPLKTLKDGSYVVSVVPFAPMGSNYSGLVQVGKDAKAASAGFSLSPMAGSAPLTVTLDARALSTSAPAGGYVFEFGDGSAPVTDMDGVVEHTYQSNGQYLSRVRFSDASTSKGLSSAAQTVFVGDLDVVGKAGANRMGGSFGLGLLSGLAALGLGRRRMRG